jgi:hypothetical protein
MTDLAKLLIIIGLVITFSGGFILFATRLFPWFGNLPGDLRFESDNAKIFIPLGTMVLVSIIGTILLNIILRLFRR